jgi:hypothetical protein
MEHFENCVPFGFLAVDLLKTLSQLALRFDGRLSVTPNIAATAHLDPARKCSVTQQPCERSFA